MSEDLSLVTDENVAGRSGWKRSRFGRAVAVIKVKMQKKSKKVSLVSYSIKVKLHR
jgi:hypothetical protein